MSLAKFISALEKEHNIAHGGANIGCWMLGSNYVEDPEEFDSVLRALVGKSLDQSSVLSIANRFENFFGKFGSILRDIVAHNQCVHPIAEKSGSG